MNWLVPASVVDVVESVQNWWNSVVLKEVDCCEAEFVDLLQVDVTGSQYWGC